MEDLSKHFLEVRKKYFNTIEKASKIFDVEYKFMLNFVNEVDVEELERMNRKILKKKLSEYKEN